MVRNVGKKKGQELKVIANGCVIVGKVLFIERVFMYSSSSKTIYYKEIYMRIQLCSIFRNMEYWAKKISLGKIFYYLLAYIIYFYL